MHGGATTNKYRLETHKVKDKKNNLVINRQRNTIIKIKKNYYFEYILSYKNISNKNSQKEYIRILRYFEYIYLIYINSFLFKIYEIGIIKYQTLII